MNQTLNLTFGQCVRALRQEKGLTQVVFSERCGFYQTYLSRIENGQANPTLNAMEVIATGLGLTIFALFERVRQRLEPAAVADLVPLATPTDVADNNIEPPAGSTLAQDLPPRLAHEIGF